MSVPLAVALVLAATMAGVVIGMVLAGRGGGSGTTGGEEPLDKHGSPGATEGAATGWHPSREPAEPSEEALPGPLKEAVDHVEHGVVVIDGNGEEVYRNLAASRLGSARDSRTLVESALTRLVGEASRGCSRREEVELFGPPAQLYVVSAHPFRQRSGTGVLVVVEDRTDARRTETVRRDFVANISHELKTPVGALGLLAETVRDEDDPEVRRRLAERMVAEAERAARTIDDLLELSSIEFGDETEFTRLDLAEVVGEATSRIATAAEQAGVGLQVHVPDDVLIEGDRRQLVSAVFNLLDNAVKYTPGGGLVRVRAVAEEPTGVLALSVQDDGIGIPRRSLERIFERFYRVDRARSRNTGGTGLGLAIVRHVVSNHGGQVVAESVEGEGSTFTLLMPVLVEATDAPVGVRRVEDR
jgi:two-component system sensor histidine kinase SenX3